MDSADAYLFPLDVPDLQTEFSGAH
jgi:hypothetical protein